MPTSDDDSELLLGLKIFMPSMGIHGSMTVMPHFTENINFPITLPIEDAWAWVEPITLAIEDGTDNDEPCTTQPPHAMMSLAPRSRHKQ